MNYLIKSTLIFAILFIGCNDDEPKNAAYNQPQPINPQTQSAGNLQSGELIYGHMMEDAFCAQVGFPNIPGIEQALQQQQLNLGPCPQISNIQTGVLHQCQPIQKSKNAVTFTITAIIYDHPSIDPNQLQQLCNALLTGVNED